MSKKRQKRRATAVAIKRQVVGAQGVAIVFMRKRSIRLTINATDPVTGLPLLAYVDIDAEGAANLAERLDNCSHTLSARISRREIENNERLSNPNSTST